MWVPFKRFPITQKTKKEIENFITPVQELLDEYGVSGKTYRIKYI